MKKLTYESCKNLPNGTILKIIKTGEEWEDDIFKTYTVIKLNNRLLEISSSYWDIDEIDDEDGYEIEVFYYPKDNAFRRSTKEETDRYTF